MRPTTGADLQRRRRDPPFLGLLRQASLAVGYFYGYFWTASSAIYLLLRRDVDATETDEVFLDADKSEPERGLPPLGTDQAGGPRGERRAGENRG